MNLLDFEKTTKNNNLEEKIISEILRMRTTLTQKNTKKNSYVMFEKQKVKSIWQIWYKAKSGHDFFWDWPGVKCEINMTSIEATPTRLIIVG